MPPRQILRVTFAWRCPTCRTSPLPLSRPRKSTTTAPRTAGITSSRHFSTSRSPQATSPLSPHYFEIPKPAQQDAIKPTRAKGTLPIPHDVFHPRKGGLARAQWAAIEPNIPPRTRERGPHMREQVPLQAWKRKMASMRRDNLEGGLTALERRRVRQDRATESRRIWQDEQKRNRRVTAASRRHENDLSAPSVTAAMQTLSGTTMAPDPHREDKIAASKANVQRHNNLASQKRADALHTLYMRARNFIVTEEQLNETIDAEFGSEGNERLFGARGIGIWETLKGPDTIRRLAHQANVRAGAVPGGPVDVNAQLSQRRLKRIAEEMTGGKM